ncbi:hypothetical protein MKY88_17810 [Lysinibacillus sp. FSL R7-0073]|nr:MULTISPECIES: hypothetical protein [Lysinibacillus]
MDKTTKVADSNPNVVDKTRNVTDSESKVADNLGDDPSAFFT